MIYNLARGLTEKGHKVTLFASGDSTKEFPLVSVSPIALFRDQKLVRPQAYNYLILKKLLEQADNFDIIHDHSFYEPLILAGLIKTKMIHTIHLEVVPEMRELFLACPEVIYTALSNDHKNRSGLKNCQVIYNGIDIAPYKFQEKATDNYLVWLGRISHLKGTKEAILVAKEAGEKLIIAGKVNKVDEEYYQKEIKPSVDDRQIKYIGEVDDWQKSNLLGGAKALISPINWDEPFGLVVVEAMACGTPVIANNRGAMVELIQNDQTGFLTENWQEMVGKIKRVDNLDRLLCRKTVEDRFTLERMVDQYELLYQQII